MRKPLIAILQCPLKLHLCKALRAWEIEIQTIF